MSNNHFRSTVRRADEKDLSALLDGELPEDRERELRRRIAEEPDLAARCAELAEADGVLQRLAASELDSERLGRIHQNLRARIDGEKREIEPDSRGAKVLPFPAIQRTVIAAAALAAALALYLALGTGSEPGFESVPVQVTKSTHSVPEANTQPPEVSPSQLADMPVPETAYPREETNPAIGAKTSYPVEEVTEDVRVAESAAPVAESEMS